jgi:hypothetical protein
MAQAVSHRPVITEALVYDPFSPCWICGGQSVIWTGFCTSSSVVLCQYYSTAAIILLYYVGNKK